MVYRGKGGLADLVVGAIILIIFALANALAGAL